MTKLTQRMREELVRRNYAESTIRAYLRTVEEFRQYGEKRLDYMQPDDIRRYQVHLLEDRKLGVDTYSNHVGCSAFSVHEYAELTRDETALAQT